MSRELILWDVDTQRDFLLPGGKLYVPGAEKRIPALKRLVDLAREGRAFLVSTTDAHTPQDPEMREWPLHCIRGTRGQEKIPETLTARRLVIPNDAAYSLPRDLRSYQQLILEKQTLDDFDNPNTERVLKQLGKEAEYCVFGVVTEYCVRLAVLGLLKRGFRVAVVTDAIETLKEADGRKAIEEFVKGGARLLETEEVVALVEAGAPTGAKG